MKEPVELRQEPTLLAAASALPWKMRAPTGWGRIRLDFCASASDVAKLVDLAWTDWCPGSDRAIGLQRGFRGHQTPNWCDRPRADLHVVSCDRL